MTRSVCFLLVYLRSGEVGVLVLLDDLFVLLFVICFQTETHLQNEKALLAPLHFKVTPNFPG